MWLHTTNRHCQLEPYLRVLVAKPGVTSSCFGVCFTAYRHWCSEIICTGHLKATRIDNDWNISGPTRCRDSPLPNEAGRVV